MGGVWTLSSVVFLLLFLGLWILLTYRTAAVAELGLIFIIIVVLVFFSCGLLGFGKKELVGLLLGW